jgi:pentatricopeptide repeat protein
MRVEDDALVGDLECAALVCALAVNGRAEEARELFERLLDLRNDVGLLAEEYDVGRRRQVGNFPQAFSHLALIEAAREITTAHVRTSPEGDGHAPLREPAAGRSIGAMTTHAGESR